MAGTNSEEDLELLRAIAREPRPTGSDAIAAARGRCAEALRALGFQVRERSFDFSEFPGRFATPLIGATGAFAVGVAGALGLQGARIAPLVLLVSVAVAMYGGGVWLAKHGVLDAPVLRSRGINLEATRPGDVPAIWLCAHLDSKSQPVPTLLRSAGIVLEGAGYVLMLTLAIAAAAGARTHSFFWAFTAIVTLVGALPVILSMVGARSPGALDNASGVVAAMSAMRQLGDRSGIGLLITDAEELGLAGARAWSAQAPSNAVMLNYDGVDDVGEIQVMFTGKRPARLLNAVERASRTNGTRYRVARLVPGVLTDSVAFADAGMPTVTFSRGSWRSLARVHSPRDDLGHLSGTGVAEVAALVTGTAREIGATSSWK
jgi:hypothetical protein